MNYFLIFFCVYFMYCDTSKIIPNVGTITLTKKKEHGLRNESHIFSVDRGIDQKRRKTNVIPTSIHYRGCCIFFKSTAQKCCIHMETNGCDIWAFTRRLCSQFKQGGHTCYDTGPRFLRSQPKDSLDPHVHRPLTLLSFLCYIEYLHHTSMETVII